MIGTILGAAAGIGSALLQQRAQRKALERQQEGLGRQYDLAQEMLEKTRPERQTLTQADLIRKQRAMEDPIADQQRKEAERQAATNVQALTMAGPRGLAMLGQQQRAAADVQARIGGESERRTERTLSQIAGREQQIQQFNALQDQRFREAQAELEMGRLGAEESIAGQLAGLKGAGMAAALGGLSSVGYGLEGTQAGRRMDEQVGGLFGRRQQRAAEELAQQKSAALAEGFSPAAINPFADAGQIASPQLASYSGFSPMELMLAGSAGEAAEMGYNKYGGKIADARKGMMLPGKFNHANNPIALMRNGRKIGEATGDEIVLNPEQINKISKQSSYLRKLLKQPRFQ